MNSSHLFFNLNPINFFIISGLIQNFILSGILFFRKAEQSIAHRLIAAVIIIINLHLTYLMMLDTNIDNLFPFILRLPYSALTAIGPLIYFYTLSLSGAELALTSKNLRHFIPLACEIAIQIFLITSGIINDVLLYNTSFYFYIMPLFYAFSAVSVIYYLRKSLQVIQSHEQWALGNFSNMKEITLKWLQKLIVYFRWLWTIWIPFIAIFLFFFRFQLQYFAIVLALYVLMLFLTYFTFWIGLDNLIHATTAWFKVNAPKAENKNFSRLSPHEIHDMTQRINRAMEVDKVYLNENLSLKDFALHIEADPNLVSHIINNDLRQNFHDFVNRHRIEAVKEQLNNSSLRHLTLLGIALGCGFNSKTTFNRVFRQVTGMTPTEFQKKQSEM